MNEIKKTVEELKKKYSKVICDSQEKAREMAEDAAKSLLPCLSAFPVRMGETLRSLGFEVWVTEFTDRSVSGALALNARTKHPMVIGVNKEDSRGHQCFTLAHELAHYIFDIDDDKKKVIRVNYNTSINNDDNLVEYRANKFAACLLMPEKYFKTQFSIIKRKYSDSDIQIEALALSFNVSKKAVILRMEELGIE